RSPRLLLPTMRRRAKTRSRKLLSPQGSSTSIKTTPMSPACTARAGSYTSAPSQQLVVTSRPQPNCSARLRSLLYDYQDSVYHMPDRILGKNTLVGKQQ